MIDDFNYPRFFRLLIDHCLQNGDPEKKSQSVNGRSFVFSFDNVGACSIDEIEPVRAEDMDLSGSFVISKKKH